MPKIQAITDEMLGRANNIGQGAADILSSQNNVTKIIQNLGAGFSGRIPNLMTQQMLAMESTYQAVNENLTGYQAFLENAANTYEWTDQEVANWATALGDRGMEISQQTAAPTTADAGTPNETISPTPVAVDQIAPANIGSGYYTREIPGVRRLLNNTYNGRTETHLNCVYYARGRALEKLGTEIPTGQDYQSLHANSIAHFGSEGNRHDVFIEDIDLSNPNDPEIYYSEGNWFGDADGELKHQPKSAFLARYAKFGQNFSHTDYF